MSKADSQRSPITFVLPETEKTARRHFEAASNSTLPSLHDNKRKAPSSVTSRESKTSGTHDLFLRNRETLLDLIVRKLRHKYVDSNPYYYPSI